jgi:hypothetical protein
MGFLYGLKPVPFKLKPVPFKLKPVPFKLTHYRCGTVHKVVVQFERDRASGAKAQPILWAFCTG